jgi:hypothetical protein
VSAWQDELARIEEEPDEGPPTLSGGRRAPAPSAGDGRGRWRPGDEGPPDAERPDDYERRRLPPGGWLELAGWVPDHDGRWVRPDPEPGR